MDSIKLCKILEECTYVVVVFDKDEIVSTGSGVAINRKGDLITAAHVITKLPVKKENLKDPNLTVVARTKTGRYAQYKPGVTGPAVHLKYFRNPLTIDLAILKPSSPKEEVPFIPISKKKVDVGTKVLMAGFPDEMELPFSFDKILDYRHPEVRSKLKKLELLRPQLMVKSGMVGYQSGFIISDTSTHIELSGDIFYVDNAMHSGASGGPIINEQGELIGIITQRAITAVPFEESPELKVPSGSAVAVSPRAMLPFIEET